MQGALPDCLGSTQLKPDRVWRWVIPASSSGTRYHICSACVLTAGLHADENGSMHKQELIGLVLVCALHGHDPDLDAPWASQESSAQSMSILSRLAHAAECADAGMTRAHTGPPLGKHPSHCELISGTPPE